MLYAGYSVLGLQTLLLPWVLADAWQPDLFCELTVLVQALANQVCEKVESKVRTTYNEVADELVSEFGNVEGTGGLRQTFPPLTSSVSISDAAYAFVLCLYIVT